VFEDVEDFFAVLREKRRTPVVIPNNFNSLSRILVKLPPNYEVKELPKAGALSNRVAEFLSSSKVTFGSLTCERYLGIKQRVIPLGSDYDDLLAFYQAVMTQDRTPFTAVVKPKTPPAAP
jgi:hypothetical protein